MRKYTDTVPFAHPPSRTYPITVHSSRLEEGRSHKLNPTRNAVRQSKPRVEQPGNRLRLSHILTTHVKVQRFRAQLQTNAAQDNGSHGSRSTDRAQTQARITREERKRGGHTDAETRREAPEKVSRGASRRRCKHGRTTSSQRRSKAQRVSGCRTVVRELDVDGGSQKRKVSRGASRRRCKHGRTTSSRRKPKSSVSQARADCRREGGRRCRRHRQGKARL